MNTTMDGGETALVLGGGVGGVIAANSLRKLLDRKKYRVVLVEREANHVFQPSLLWLAVGDRQPDRIQRPMRQILRRGVEIVQAEVTDINPVARAVRAGGRELTGDAMIVSLGADLTSDATPGLAAAGHNLYTLEGATAFRDALASLRKGRIVVLTATAAYKCPAAPYEAAMLIEAAMRHRGVRPQVSLDLFAAEPGPMGVAGPEVSAAVRQLLEVKRIGYHPAHQLTAVDSALRRLTFANGTTAEFDLLLYVPVHRAPAAVRASGLVNESGWIPVDRTTFETRFKGVFAVGDVTTVPLSMGKPLPKAGVFAHAEADVVAANIASAWTGAGTFRAFDGEGQCFLETGDGRAAIGAGNFYGEPTPEVTLYPPSRRWHWGKVLFEKRWLGQG